MKSIKATEHLSNDVIKLWIPQLSSTPTGIWFHVFIHPTTSNYEWSTKIFSLHFKIYFTISNTIICKIINNQKIMQVISPLKLLRHHSRRYITTVKYRAILILIFFGVHILESTNSKNKHSLESFFSYLPVAKCRFSNLNKTVILRFWHKFI